MRVFILRTTFLLLSYNQEKYAAAAVLAAITQEGEPITVLISDDASTDHTFDVIQHIVSGYSGPHKVVLNRNSSNLGLAAHINSCMARINTDYVIAGAADDISMPHRARILQQAFDTTGALLLHSRFAEIDQFGNCVNGTFPLHAATLIHDTSALRAARRMSLYVGATGAWHRELFDRYGGIGEDCYEDLIIGFRAALEDSIGFVDEELVRYRVDTGISVIDRKPVRPELWTDNRVKSLSRTKAVFKQRLNDANISNHPEKIGIAMLLHKEINNLEMRRRFHTHGCCAFLSENISRPISATYIAVSEWRKHRKANRRHHTLSKP